MRLCFLTEMMILVLMLGDAGSRCSHRGFPPCQNKSLDSVAKQYAVRNSFDIC